MRGAGFLDVEKFPEIAYKSEHVSFYDGEPIRVDGELTLVGVTCPVPLRVYSHHCTDPVDLELQRCMMDATAIFRRSEFRITGSMPLAGDKVRLAIHVEATADAIPAASRTRSSDRFELAPRPPFRILGCRAKCTPSAPAGAAAINPPPHSDYQDAARGRDYVNPIPPRNQATSGPAFRNEYEFARKFPVNVDNLD
jgi:YceI-like protein